VYNVLLIEIFNLYWSNCVRCVYFSQDMTDSPPDSRQVIVVMDSFKSKIIRLRVRSAAFYVTCFYQYFYTVMYILLLVAHPPLSNILFLKKIHKNERQ